MSKPEIFALRLRRLHDLVKWRFGGNRTALARVLGHHDGSFVRKMLTGGRLISEKTVARIEAATGLDGWFDQETDLSVAMVPGEAAMAALSTMVPVLGTTTTGLSRALDWLEPFEPCDGDAYVDAFVAPLADPRHAYALRVAGSHLSPRSSDGEYLVLAPHAPCEAGDDVVLKTLEGDVLVGQLAAVYDEHVVLIVLTPVLRRLAWPRGSLASIHTVCMRLPRRRGRRHVDRPGYRGPDRRVRQIPVAVDRRRAVADA